VLDGQVWRLVTSSFLHANIVHLVLNMYALYVLGSHFEKVYSGRNLFSLYILAGIGGSIMSSIATMFRFSLGISDPDIYTVGVGASGAIFGILGFFVVAIDSHIDKQQLYWLIFLNLFIGFAFAGTIDNWAHIGGLITGMGFGIFDNQARFKLRERSYGFLFWLCLLLFIVSYLALIAYNIFQIFSS
jgi:rhomboid protease GluP